MIQATNELILGIDLQEEYTQVTYYHKSVREPLTLSITPQENQPLLPMAVRQIDIRIDLAFLEWGAGDGRERG